MSTKVRKMPDVPQNPLDPVALTKFLRDVKNQLDGVVTDKTPVANPTNLQVVPLAAANLVRFTKSNGDNYILYISTTPNISDATTVNLGDNCSYTDQLGTGGVNRWYWVQGSATGRLKSQIVGPVGGVTLAVGTSVTVPTAPTQTNTTYSKIGPTGSKGARTA